MLKLGRLKGLIEEEDGAADGGKVPVNARLYRERNGNPVLLQRQVIVTGDQIKDAASGRFCWR